jgi:plastocyanin domain-containing protein
VGRNDAAILFRKMYVIKANGERVPFDGVETENKPISESNTVAFKLPKTSYMKITKMKNRSQLYKAVLVLLSAVVLSLATLEIVSAQSRNPFAQTSRPKTQKARVEVDKMGFQPGSLTLKRGQPAEITFVRKTDQTCATEVVFADYGVRRDLPLNQAVIVRFTPTKAGDFSFTCGMNMHRGKLIVR